jgi:uncharacterized protein YgbK (DUF1537 family)
MPNIVIIADDLTGANATGVLLARHGFEAATFLNLDKYDPNRNQDLKVVSISTDSRGVKKDIAYGRVKEVVDFFKDDDIKLFAKRIDSTLRGNIGTEIDGVLDSLSNDTIALVVPAFPSSGRVCIGGYLMVNQIPLEKTEVEIDPKAPVKTSKVTSIINNQTNKKLGFIDLDKVLKGIDSIKNALSKEIENGSRIIIIDATTDEDIDNIAKAVKNMKVNLISVDPGPFTAALSKELLGEPEVGPGQKLMVTVGSVSNLTRKQMEEFKLACSPLILEVNAKKLIYDSSCQEEVNRVSQELLKNIHNYNIIGVTTTNNEEDVIDLNSVAKELNITEDEVSQKITKGLAKITKNVLEKSNSIIGGLYTSGGDVTIAVCKELEAVGIKVKDEVLPLAVYGKILEGKYHNTSIITKGGLIGDKKAMIKCTDYLLTKLSNEYHIKK